MKKSIKYAGIAAATLLTVAPIAAPVVSTVTTAQAADAQDTDQSAINTALSDFKNQFGDQKDTDVDLSNASNITLALGESNEKDLSAFLTNADKGIVKTPNADQTKAFKALEDQDAKVYTIITDAKSTVYDGTIGKSASDLNDAMALDSYKPVTVQVMLKYKDLATGTYTKYAEAAKFQITKSNSDEIKSLDAKFTTPLTVAKNSKTAATQLVNGANVSLTDQNNDSIATQAINLGKKYYYTYKAAMDSATTAGTTDTDVAKNGDINSDNEFKTAGTYYQVVTYTAQDGSALDSLITKYATDPSSYTIYVNGKKASAGYDFVTGTDTTSVSGKTLNTISFVRAINVSDSEAEWTTTDTTGVVTTKADHAYYTLKDDDGNVVTNRALAKNTAWKTNAVRVDQNGNKQYRVGGSEWIDANDVTFSDKATDNNNGEGAYTDVKALNGKVVTAGPSGFVYPLFDDNGKQVTNRAVAGDTAWYTDKSAVNAEGTTVYHVATGEWLQGNNVTYSAY
ncbi:hypothetical protein [Companilactobacillus muriivasis]|uniref:hypothetical protein n=1 Tax=Companilactobacillus muriivasis TaxID=3081444 RepID=UPI0030C6FB7F